VALRVAVLASLSLSSTAWCLVAWTPAATATHQVVHRFPQSLRQLLRGGGFAGTRMSTLPPGGGSCALLKGSRRADKWLRDNSIEFSIVQQDQATGKCRDSAAERGVSLKQIVKSMVFSLGEESTYCHCMVPGHLQVDKQKLQKIVGKPVRLVESDELEQATGAKVGGVHPFVPGVSRRLVDKRILQNAADGGQVSFNTGDMTVGVLITCDAFMSALGNQADVVDIAISEHGEEHDDLAQELGISVSNARFLLEHDFARDYFDACIVSLPASERSARSEVVLEWMRTLVRFAAQVCEIHKRLRNSQAPNSRAPISCLLPLRTHVDAPHKQCS
jgi:prolyl-tRNA editing enzyme YbaK/EbsC (Cys-tRNA(Pro) deacylase)